LFQVIDPAARQRKEAQTISVMDLPPLPHEVEILRAKLEVHELRSQHDELTAEREQLQVKYNLLEADRDRLATECERMSADLERAAIEASAVRSALGTIAPGDVPSLVDERNSLRTEVGRSAEQIDRLRAEQFAREEKLALLDHHKEELTGVCAERDALARSLEERQAELIQARADHARLVGDQRNARGEIEKLGARLGEMQAREEELLALRTERGVLLRTLEERQAELVQARADHARTAGDERSARGEIERVRASLGEMESRSRELAAVRTEREAIARTLEARQAELTQARTDCARAVDDQRKARDEVERIRALLGELKSRGQELAAVRAERETLARTLEERQSELSQARADRARLADDERTARNEIERLQAVFGEREHALVCERDQLRGKIKTLQGALECARAAHGGGATSGAVNGVAQHAGQSSAGNGHPDGPGMTVAGALEAALTDVEKLKERLLELERLNRQMSTVLWGTGIEEPSAP
jgi:chromosome segregation ATPase